MPDTLDQLRELPDLAAECWATWDAPNPAQRAARGTRQLEPPAPTNLAAYDTLRTDEHGQLFRLTQCVRTVVETMTTHPDDLAETPTWASETAWLIRHADFWQADQWCSEYVTSEVAQVHGELSRQARIVAVTVACPVYGCTAELQRGEWDDERKFHIWPDHCPEGHPVDFASLVRAVEDSHPKTLPEIAALVERSERTLQLWAQQKLITPVDRLKPARYLLKEVQSLILLGTRKAS